MNPERKALYELCERENVAIDVMKAFGGGDMLNAELSPFGVAFNEYQCMEYCLTRPGTVAVMAGCHSIDEMEKLVSYYEAAAEEKDYSTVLAGMEKFKFQGNCMYCGHCAPCSVGINVADVNKYLNLALVGGSAGDGGGPLQTAGASCLGMYCLQKMRKQLSFCGWDCGKNEKGSGGIWLLV